jgi:hypothetical protein
MQEAASQCHSTFLNLLNGIPWRILTVLSGAMHRTNNITDTMAMGVPHDGEFKSPATFHYSLS